jgi:hypothetical protein
MLAAGAVAFIRKEDAVEVLYKTVEFASCQNRRPFGSHDTLNTRCSPEIKLRRIIPSSDLSENRLARTARLFYYFL